MQNPALQNLVVAAIVVAAIVYAVWRFMPAALKLKLARMVGASEERVRKLGNSGACGSCSSCKACPTPAEKNGRTLHPQK
jgi:hypothetical protein